MNISNAQDSDGTSEITKSDERFYSQTAEASLQWTKLQTQLQRTQNKLAAAETALARANETLRIALQSIALLEKDHQKLRQAASCCYQLHWEQTVRLQQSAAKENKQILSYLKKAKDSKLALIAENLESSGQTIAFDKELAKEALQISASGLFDASWYITKYPDVAEHRLDPLWHYIKHGTKELRDPNQLFKTSWYLEKNPDVAAAGINPLLHFIQRGWLEERDPSPYFSIKWYLNENPDLRDSGVNPLTHFLSDGWRERRDPSEEFSQISPSSEWLQTGEAFNPHLFLLTHGDEDIESVLEDYGHQNWDTFYGRRRIVGWRERLLNLQASSFPKISVVVPLYKVPLNLLELAVQSVLEQQYDNWELCLVDDGSNDESLTQYIKALAEKEPRIKIQINPTNQGISACTNDALALASGDLIAFLDQDDELTPDALGEMVTLFTEHPETDAAYSDHDKMDMKGKCYEPHHKPIWSPVCFLGVMYVGHLLVVRKPILDQLGGLDSRFDKVQDFELMLRLSEVSKNIRHIPKILYHWRAAPGSIAGSTEAKSKIEPLQLAAVQAHLERLGVSLQVDAHTEHAHRLTLGYDREPSSQPLVSIIIPTTARSSWLVECIESIVSKTNYALYEILVLVSHSPARTSAQKENLDKIKDMESVQIVEYDFPFNYSRVNNYGASKAKGEILLFLNDDTQVMTPFWLQILLSHLSLPGVGAVGPKLLSPTGRVQHAGVVLGLRGTADHVMRNFPADGDGYFGSLSVSREVAAVTAACLMMRATTFQTLGGMKEYYASIYQDVDLCLRLRELNLSILYVANVELLHHESATRGPDYDIIDRELLIDTWRDQLSSDPYYNINFTRNRYDYTIIRK